MSGKLPPAPTQQQIETRFRQALACHQHGQIGDAQAIYQEILKIQPRHFNSRHLLGVAAFQSGRIEIAIKLISEAISIDPQVPAAYNNLGNALLDARQWHAALTSFDRALALEPDYVEAIVNRTYALKELGRMEEALAACDQALKLRPDDPQIVNNRGNALLQLGRAEDALTAFDQVLARHPDHAEAWNNQGSALKRLGRPDAALASFARALALTPAYLEAAINRSVLLRELKRPVEALAAFDQVLSINPDHTDTLVLRGAVLLEMDRPAEALVSYEKARALEPDMAFLYGNNLHIKMQLCDWGRLAEHRDRLAEEIRAGRPVCPPFAAIGLFDDPALHRKAAEIYAAAKYPRDDAVSFAAHAPGDRIRIGYYSADFYNHATAYLMAELFEAHDSRKFEICGFSYGPAPADDMRKRVSGAFDQFIDVAARSDREVAELSRSMGIDIAIDLKGYTKNERPGLFAAGCAPIQVGYLGYPGTLGAGYMDYLIADKVVIPPGRERHYTEKIVYLPHSYQVNDAQRMIADKVFSRKELGLPETGIVFCCFNRSYKILPDTFSSWVRIAQAVEGSVLWLFETDPYAVLNLRKEASSRGLDPHRLVFATQMPLDLHLARQRAADLFLDTFPYNAHTTASDALWAGLPLLTRAGESFASRVAASLLHAIGMPELVTTTPEDFERRAIELARGPAALAKLKRRLEHNRLTRPLFDGRRFAKHIEAAYAAMVERYRNKLPPDHLHIEPA